MTRPMPALQRALARRRSARAFGAAPLSPATVRAVLRLARRAPSEFNLQPWRVLVCHDAGARRRLRACCLDQAHVEAAGVAFVVFGSTRDLSARAGKAAADLVRAGRLTHAGRTAGAAFIRATYADPGRARWHAFRNGVILAHHFLVCGLALGLDGFWLGGIDEPALRRAFAVPDDLVLAGVIGLGHARDRGQRVPRRPLAEILLPAGRTTAGARRLRRSAALSRRTARLTAAPGRATNRGRSATLQA